VVSTRVMSPGPIHWRSPWFAAVRDVGERLDFANANWRACASELATQRLVCNQHGLPISFVDQTALPRDISYEQHINATGQVPSRNNLHDYFNALVWLSFPSIKQQLNAMQAAWINQYGIGVRRGPVRDAATLFDESSALLIVRSGDEGDHLIHALQQHNWLTLFLELRNQFNALCQVVLFGHALLEKMVQPYKAITTHAWIIRASADLLDSNYSQQQTWLDQQVSEQIQSKGLTGFNTSRFMPLPVSGIPGWWPNQDADFYADKMVFRPI